MTVAQEVKDGLAGACPIPSTYDALLRILSRDSGGAASGYLLSAVNTGLRITGGTFLCTKSGANAVATGLSTVSFVVGALNTAPTADMDQAIFAKASTAGSIDITPYKPTSATTTTPAAATQNWMAVYWLALGT